MTWFSNLIAALRFYLEWKAQAAKNKAISVQYDLERRIEREMAEDERQLARLRASGDPVDALAADRLRQRILRAKGIAAGLPTPGTAPGEGRGRADS